MLPTWRSARSSLSCVAFCHAPGSKAKPQHEHQVEPSAPTGQRLLGGVWMSWSAPTVPCSGPIGDRDPDVVAVGLG